MHKKYAAEGFVAISVSLDNPKDADARAASTRSSRRRKRRE